MALTISYTGVPPQVILFDKEPVSYAGDQAIHRFSIGRSRDSFGMANRSIVTHIGTDKGNGTWICAKRETSCIHIRTAKRYMQYGAGDYSDGEESDDQMNREGLDICEQPKFAFFFHQFDGVLL